jgi:hypothetical protein
MLEVLCSHPKSTEFRLHECEASLRMVARQEHACIARNDKTTAHTTKRDLGLALSGTIAGPSSMPLPMPCGSPLRFPLTEPHGFPCGRDDGLGDSTSDGLGDDFGDSTNAVKRALKAAQEANLPISSVRIEPDGTIIVQGPPQPPSVANEWDE